MSFLNDLASKATSILGGAAGEQSGLAGSVISMLSDQSSGGLAGLVQSFQQKGLGDIISSWISTGQNLPISPEQISEGLGSETLQNLAAKAGISPDEISTTLSGVLPGIVDKLTPDGTLPDADGLLAKGLDFLKSQLS